MTLSLDPTKHELHNLELRDGRCFVRPGLATHTTLSAGSVHVGGFTIEDSRTSDPWHYIFTQSTTTLAVTLTVYDEELSTVFSLGLGPMPASPVITWGVLNQQIWIDSPSFSVPLYGVVGSGLVPATKTEVLNDDLTSLECPEGHCCVWKDRVCVAQGDNVLINTGSLDPRTFIPQNVVNVGGTITDLFEGPDGALWVFTTDKAVAIPADALSQSQIAISFISTIPGVPTVRPRNAIATCGTILALGRDGLVLVTDSAQKRVDVTPYEGARSLSPSLEVSDYRAEAQLFPTPNGAVVAFGGAQPFALLVDLRNGFNSYLWPITPTANDLIVGVLRSREGAPLLLTRTRLLEFVGTTDPAGTFPRGIACARAPIDADASPSLRRVTVSANNVGLPTYVYAAGLATQRTTPASSADTILGTSTWSSTTTYGARSMRTNRHSYPGTRLHEVLVEYGALGSYRHVSLVDFEFKGQATNRRSAGA